MDIDDKSKEKEKEKEGINGTGKIIPKDEITKQVSDTPEDESGLVEMLDADTEVKDLILFECPYCKKVYEVMAETLDEIGVDYYEGFIFKCDNEKCGKRFKVQNY